MVEVDFDRVNLLLSVIKNAADHGKFNSIMNAAADELAAIESEVRKGREEERAAAEKEAAIKAAQERESYHKDKPIDNGVVIGNDGKPRQTKPTGKVNPPLKTDNHEELRRV